MFSRVFASWQTVQSTPLFELMPVCVCVCVCVYIYTHTHTHTHTGISSNKGVLWTVCQEAKTRLNIMYFMEMNMMKMETRNLMKDMK